MAQTALLLGSVPFQDFEVASGVSFGGAQRIAQHDLPGGGRVLDALGDAQSAITISGTLYGADATVRARTLAALRGAGAVLPLTWDVFFYSVVVQTFAADFKSPWWIPFRLTCAVLRDEATGLLGAALSLGAALASDLAAAAARIPPEIDLSAAVSAAAAPEAATRGTAAYAAASDALGSAASWIASGQRGAEAGLSPDALFGAGDASYGAAAVQGASSTANLLAGFAVAGAYVGRAAANLSNAST